MKQVYIGIDPGKSGAIAAIIDTDGWHEVRSIKNDATDYDLSAWLDDLRRISTACFAYIENVHSSPQMGVKSAFTFGESRGFLRGLLTAHRIAYEQVSPQKWQKVMNCMSKGDKNVTKAAAQRLFPLITITHANADALLLAEYCRRMRNA